jgi:molybdopterin-guanine dinucleotide biosynthesis protein A
MGTDDPKVEHGRWYPQCSYIRQYLGEDLYEAIQRKNRELKSILKTKKTRSFDFLSSPNSSTNLLK